MKHILSATSTQIFRFLWFMPSLGVCSPWVQHRKLSLKIERLVDQQVDTLEFKCLCPPIPHCTMGQKLLWSCTWIFTKKKWNFNLEFNKERMTLSSDTIIVWNIQNWLYKDFCPIVLPALSLILCYTTWLASHNEIKLFIKDN